MDTPLPPQAVRALVSHRVHDAPQPAVRYGDVLIRDETHYRHAGPRRYFWLLDQGVQLVYEPYGWTDEWYVDIVSIRCTQHVGLPRYAITDSYVDLVVEAMGPTYRILDLDELAQALRSGRIEPAAAADALSRAQRFVDAYLHRRAPFPPPQIRPFFNADHRYQSIP
jgi:hypothetical protein